MKAFLLHHAGGDKYAYLNMQQNLLPEVQAFAFELPGRSDRINEPFIKNIYDAVDDIYKQLLPHLQDNYCIVGNSMGAAVAYLLSHKLKQEKKTLRKPSSKIGLQNLAERYKLITGKEIIVQDVNNAFTVLLPLLKIE